MLAYAPTRHRAKKSLPSLAFIIGLHAAALTAVLLAKPGFVVAPPTPPTTITLVNDPPPPPPADKKLPPAPKAPAPSPRTLHPVVDIPVAPKIFTPFVQQPVVIPGPTIEGIGNGGGSAPGADPVRTAPQLLTAPDRLRPPYPESRRRMGEEATLQLELTIGADGRVTAVSPIGAVDPAFLRAAERHILRVWRFAPATEDGRKVPARKTISLRFELEG